MAISGQKSIDEMVTEIGWLLFQQTAPGTNTFPTSAMIAQVLNDNYRMLASKKDWKWLYQQDTFPTVAGQKTYVMPDNLKDILGLKIESIPIHLIKYDTAQFYAYNPKGWTGIANSVPRIYLQNAPAADNALQIDLWPLPDVVYTIGRFWMQRVADLVLAQSPAQVFLCPPEFQDMILDLAKAECLAMKNDTRSDFYGQRYQARYARAYADDENDRDQINVLRDYYAERAVMPMPGLYFPYKSQ